MTRSIIQWCGTCKAPTLKAKCPTCGGATHNPLPPKYSPEDPYGQYRREMKKRAAKEKQEAAP